MNVAGRAELMRMPDQKLAAIAPLLHRLVRVELRDVAIRATVQRFWPEATPTAAAKLLAGVLASPANGTPTGDAATVIIAMNSGRTLGWRRILQITSGAQ